MKPYEILAIAVIAIAGLVTGNALSSRSSKERPTKDVGATVSETRNGRQASSMSQSHAGGRATPRKSTSQAVVPVASVVEILKTGYFANCDFKQMIDQMGSALSLLRATDQQREQVMECLMLTENEVYAAERQHLKPVVGAGEITFDASVMAGPIDGIIERTKENLKAILPSDSGQALVSAIDWSQFYFSGHEPSKAISLRVYQDATGSSLRASESAPWGGVDTFLNQNFKNDGTPIPADQVFSDRWKPFLKDVTLLPMK